MNKFQNLYQKLYKKYGHPSGQWKIWCKRPKTYKEREEIIIGAVLTQRTNWNNVERAISCLKEAGICSIYGVFENARKRKEKFADLIRSSGFYKQKAGYLFGLAKFIVETYGDIKEMKKQKLEKLRKELLSLKGLGKETTDSILLYALDKPIFVIDEYTRRLAKRYRLSENFSYDSLQKLFQGNLPKNYRLYQDLHALIVIEEQKRQ